MADDDVTARRTAKATSGGARKAAAEKAGAPAPAKKAPSSKAAGSKKAVAAKKPATVKKARAPRKAAAPTEAGARKVAAKKASEPVARGAILAPRKKAPPALRLAAEQTFDDDWEEPAPEPVREDPSARMRAVLRAAALSLAAKEAGGGSAAAQAPPPPPPPPPSPLPPPTPPPPTPPLPPDEPVTRVLVAPPEPEPEPEYDLVEVEDEPIEVEEEDDEEEEEGEWAAPDVLDDTEAPVASPPPPPPPPPSPPAPSVDAPPPFSPPDPRPKKAGRSGRRSLGTVLLLLLVLLAAAGAFWFLVLRDKDVDYSKLKVGDCFGSSQSDEVRGVKVEPCSKPHNSEVFFLVTHPAGPKDPYPGKDALVQFAADACLGQPLTDYLGIPLEQSKLKDFEIVPQESAWKDGRRVLVCGIDTGGQGDITGSVKGTRR